MSKTNKLKTILLTTFALLFSCVLIATTNAKAWTQDCDTIDEQMLELYDEMWSSTGACTLSIEYGLWNYATECNSLRNQYNEMQEWSEENCVVTEPCKILFRSDTMNYQYKVDNSPYYVTKVYIEETGEIAFCAEPDTARLNCHDDYYTVSADDLTAEELIRISLAAMFYFEEPSNTHYVAAQMYIWVVITGEEWTVNGHGISYYWSELEQMIEDALNGSLSDVELETSIVETESVEIEFEYSNITVDLGSTFTNVDINGNLTNEYFTLTISPTGPDGQGDNM